MVKIPAFLLRRVYVKGSLSNVEDGFQFQLLNSLGSGYARRMLPLTLDGREMPLESCTFPMNDGACSFDQVSNDMPFTLDVNKTVTITVHGETLDANPHTVVLNFEVAGLGELNLDFTDTPAA